ncbi:hypothetical protein ONE63_011267 [Megalurothrips usitatus]|uniref:Retrotransposon gag domain-containing protein n=1 Tax=Megalurothrips usitatus TaxID=439358 RepID=A0AAV7WZS4_9NEOP|nr:hypothetical protein ONE63_011267 [Megalurothrips usitatus]
MAESYTPSTGDVQAYLAEHVASDRSPYPRFGLLLSEQYRKGEAWSSAHAAQIVGQIDSVFESLGPWVTKNWRTEPALGKIKEVGGLFNERYRGAITAGECTLYFAETAAEGLGQVPRHWLNIKAVLRSLYKSVVDTDEFSGLIIQHLQVLNEKKRQEAARLRNESDRVKAEEEATKLRLRAEIAALKRKEEEMASAAWLNSVELFGGENPTEYPVTHFLAAIDGTADLAGLTEVQKCMAARLRLKGAARRYVFSSELATTQSWATLKAALLARFDQPTNLHMTAQKFRACAQTPGETVAGFYARLAEAAQKWDQMREEIPEGEGREGKVAQRAAQLAEDMKSQFLHGLLSPIKRYVQLRDPATLEDSFRIACAEEVNLMADQMQTASISAILTNSQTNDSCFRCRA